MGFSVEFPLPNIPKLGWALFKLLTTKGFAVLVSVVSEGVEKKELFVVVIVGSRAAAIEAEPNVKGLSDSLAEGFPKLIAVELVLTTVGVTGVDETVATTAPNAIVENVLFARCVVVVELLTVVIGVLLDSVTDPKEGITGTVAPSDGRAFVFKADEPKTELLPPNENPDETGFMDNPSLGFVSEIDVAELPVLPNVKDFVLGAVVVTGLVAAEPNAN